MWLEIRMWMLPTISRTRGPSHLEIQMPSSTGIVCLSGLVFRDALAGCGPVWRTAVILGASTPSKVGARIDHGGKSVPFDLEAPHVDGGSIPTGGLMYLRRMGGRWNSH